jgi:hypothetical protein
VIVIGAIALPLLNSTMPSLLKYLVLTVSTYLAGNIIILLYRQAVAKIKNCTNGLIGVAEQKYYKIPKPDEL